MQGSTLAGTLAALTAPLAAAVAQLEAITARELEEDSWLKDGASKVAYLSQKLLECGALRCQLSGPPLPAVESSPPGQAETNSSKETSGVRFTTFVPAERRQQSVLCMCT